MKNIRNGFATIILFAFLASCSSSSKQSNPEERTFENSYKEDVSSDVIAADSPYINNSLSTGQEPYPCLKVEGDESQIIVKTSSKSNCDLVAIVKRNDTMVGNAYINAGETHTFNLPNGTYQVFFYAGNGWNPEKSMPHILTGGFVANESYSKDSPISLNYESMTYELIPQIHGNFSTKQSSANEMF